MGYQLQEVVHKEMEKHVQMDTYCLVEDHMVKDRRMEVHRDYQVIACKKLEMDQRKDLMDKAMMMVNVDGLIVEVPIKRINLETENMVNKCENKADIRLTN